MPGLRSIQALCAIVSSTAALAQKELPYHVENKEVINCLKSFSHFTSAFSIPFSLMIVPFWK